MNKRISTTLAFSVIIILAILVAGISFYLWKGIKTENSPLVNLPKKNKIVACTKEAKFCPDGSAVSRTAPNCEFAPCPEIVGIANKIIITSLKPNDEIASPVLILGSAVGGWFFEGDFPGEVYDDNGKKLGSHFCSFISKSEEDTWMTEDFVDFRCEINFSEPKTEKGYLLFKKDNPSDRRELDEEFKLPVKFSGKVNVSDWQTYRNEEYGFRFDYPIDWKVEESEGAAMPHSAWLIASPRVADKLNARLNFQIIVIKSQDNPKKWYQENYEDPDGYKNYKGQTKSLSINGYPSYYVNEIKDFYTNPTYLISNNNGLVVMFDFREKEKENFSYDKYLPDFEKMVNSLSFNKQ